MPAGRPTDLTEARSRTILDAIRTGAPERRAASFAGVHLDTLRQWRRKGDAALAKPAGRRSPTERRYAEFVTQLDVALAQVVIRMQGIVYETATVYASVQRDPDDGHVVFVPDTEARSLAFRAATWYLSHRERDDYTTRQEVTGEDGGPIELSASAAWDMLRGITERVPVPEIEAGDEEDE